jgi:hypothetical protein
VTSTALLKSVASVLLVVIGFASFNFADAVQSFNTKSFEETVIVMSATKLFRIVGKLLSSGFTIGLAAAHAMKAKRAQRGGSWLKRTRYSGLIERVRKGARVVNITALVAFALLIIVTS